MKGKVEQHLSVSTGAKGIQSNTKKRNLFSKSAVIGAVLLSFVFVGCQATTEKADPTVDEYVSYLENAEIRKAVSLYNESIIDDSEKIEKIKTKVVDLVEKADKAFLDGSVGYYETLDTLKHYGTFRPATPEIDEVRESVKTIHASNEFFAQGMESETAKNIHESVKNYSQVAEAHPKYKEAQEKITAMKAEFLEITIEQADQLANSGKKEEALLVIKDGLDIYKDDVALLEKENEYQNK